MPFGEIDQSQISGLRRIFEAANSNAEQSAMLEMQLMQEKRYRQEAGAAADIYRQAFAVSSKNPIVANNMLESTAAGLLQSRDPRSQKLAEHYGKIKFDVTPSVRSQEVINVKGLTPITRITEGRGTEGAVTRVSEIGGHAIPKETDPLLTDVRKLNIEKAKLDIAKSQQDVKTMPVEVTRVSQAFRDAQATLKTIPYSEAQLKDWATIIEKDAPAAVAALSNDEPIDWRAFLASPLGGKLTEKNIDEQRIRAVGSYLKAKSKLGAAGKNLGDLGWRHNEETDSFEKGKATKSAPTQAPTQATKKWTPPVSVQ